MNTKKPTPRPALTAEQRALYAAVRREHAENPVRKAPATAIDQGHFAMILGLVGAFRAERERQGRTLADVAERMGTDAPSLSRLETGKTLNPTIWTLCKWAEALGKRFEAGLGAREQV